MSLASSTPSWFEIEQYSIPFPTEDNKKAFALKLLSNKDNPNAPNDRSESGKYLWWLWTKGATLEAIQWYTLERQKYRDHGDMASEYPSDDIEAFVHTGAKVFDRYQVEALRSACRTPLAIGEIVGNAESGEDALNIYFNETNSGNLVVWVYPEAEDEDEKVRDRYLVVVGGRSHKADFSVIVVFDKLFMMEGGKPSIVAQWYGHTDIDLLEWKATQIAPNGLS